VSDHRPNWNTKQARSVKSLPSIAYGQTVYEPRYIPPPKQLRQVIFREGGEYSDNMSPTKVKFSICTKDQVFKAVTSINKDLARNACNEKNRRADYIRIVEGMSDYYFPNPAMQSN
jgi:hypothetical protein